jgi:hypothetical protein
MGRSKGVTDDVIALAHKLAKQLDPIAPEPRATALRLLCDRYQIGPSTGADRTRRYRSRWSAPDVTVCDGGGDGVVTDGVTVENPVLPPLTLPPSATSVVFSIPVSIREALSKSLILGKAARLRDARFWQAEIRANPGVNFAAEILRAEAWIASNPERAPRKNFARFLHTWLSRSERAGADE